MPITEIEPDIAALLRKGLIEVAPSPAAEVRYLPTAAGVRALAAQPPRRRRPVATFTLTEAGAAALDEASRG